MLVRALTRHGEGFDILSHPIDPARSFYVEAISDYPTKVRKLYRELGIDSAIWATPDSQPFGLFEIGKECEHVLEVDEGRIVAYVNETEWSAYISGELDSFEYSRLPVTYPSMSLLIPTPILPGEVKRYRRYECTNGPESFELVEDRDLSC